MTHLKKLFFAACSLLVSSAALSQWYTYAPEEGIYWTAGTPLTITYSPNGAPSQYPAASVIQILGQVEAKLDGLGLPGLDVRIGRTDLPNACNHLAPNTLHICWERRDGRRADSMNWGRTDGTNFWREGLMILGNNANWDDPTRPLYQQIQHYLLHVLGFAHPVRGEGAEPSVINNTAMDLTATDIDGLRTMYSSTRCALTADSQGVIRVPFVKYMGAGFTGRIQPNGSSEYIIVPNSLGRYGSQSFNVVSNIPLTACQNLEVDGSNEFHIPQVMINGQMRSLTLHLANGRFTVR